MKYDTVKELNKRKGCLEIKKIIENHLGSETTGQIWQKAIRKLNRMHQKYPDIPKGQESHVILFLYKLADKIQFLRVI